MDEPRSLPTREGYDRWAGVYDGDGNPLVALEERVVEPLLGDVRGLRVVDVGCGTGRHAVRLARMGAAVTGIDFSEGMLARAKEKGAGLGVRWVLGDLGTGLGTGFGVGLGASEFDVALCALVLDHVADVAGLMRGLKRVTKPGGRVVVSVMHPAMSLRGVQARFTDPGTGEKTHVASVQNRMSDYVMGMVEAGLHLVRMSEHEVDAELVRACPRAEKHLGWPLLLVMEGAA